MQLPEPIGEVVTKHEKVYVPVKSYPEVNICFFRKIGLQIFFLNCFVGF